MMLHRLEPRLFLSASLEDGLLTVIGSRFNDTIHVRLEGSQIVLFYRVSERRFPAAKVQAIRIEGRGGRDFIANGAGDIPCTLIGGAGPDVLSGGLGNDVILGAGANDRLYGQGGDDLIDGGLGNDLIAGGPGEDTVSYARRRQDVQIRLDGEPSGQAGERDTLVGIENAAGGSGDDTFIGSDGENVFDGGLGDDAFEGDEESATLIDIESILGVTAVKPLT